MLPSRLHCPHSKVGHVCSTSRRKHGAILEEEEECLLEDTVAVSCDEIFMDHELEHEHEHVSQSEYPRVRGSGLILILIWSTYNVVLHYGLLAS